MGRKIILAVFGCVKYFQLLTSKHTEKIDILDNLKIETIIEEIP